MDFIIRFNLSLFVPTLGTIISDSPYVFKDVSKLVSKLRFIQMAVDKYLGVKPHKTPSQPI